jgi:hypothetical protein
MAVTWAEEMRKIENATRPFTLSGGRGTDHAGCGDSSDMRFSRIAVIGVSALALLAGVLLGLFPIQASIIQISPVVRELSVSCGNGYLATTPPVHPGDLVELPGEPGVYLPRASYQTHCGEAVGWRRYGAWGLTALGALGLAVTFAAARTPGSSGSAESSRSAARTRGGAHRVRSGDSSGSAKLTESSGATESVDSGSPSTSSS